MPKMHPEGWTDERVERLKKMWAEGFSANDIAMTIRHVSRNAVIGKIHRLNLPKRELRKSTKPGSVVKRRLRPPLRTVFDATPQNIDALEEVLMLHTGIPKHLQRTKQLAAKVPTASLLPSPVPDLPILSERGVASQGTSSAGLSLIDLLPHHCRWPFGDPREANFSFCGGDRVPGRPYCEDCLKRAYQKPGTYVPKRPKYAVAA
jgi:GcrA cell cycle regulator